MQVVYTTILTLLLTKDLKKKVALKNISIAILKDKMTCEVEFSLICKSANQIKL